jgi:ATP synthase protein I
MDEPTKQKVADEESTFSREVGAQAARKRRARRGTNRSIWFGLGMSGLIGWSVTVPALIGAALGVWVDQHYPSQYSWTLMLLLLGLVLGCFNAWHWVESEYQAMQEGPDE